MDMARFPRHPGTRLGMQTCTASLATPCNYTARRIMQGFGRNQSRQQTRKISRTGRGVLRAHRGCMWVGCGLETDMSELMPMMLLDAIIIEISVHQASRPGHLGAARDGSLPISSASPSDADVRLGEQRILGQQVHMPSCTLAMCHDMLLTPAICTPYSVCTYMLAT